MQQNIGARLKEFREKTKTRIPEIAAITGISKETLYKWEKGTRPSNVNEYIALKSYLDRMESKMEEEEFLYDAQKPATLRLPLNSDREPVPQTNGKAAAGTIVITDNEPELIVDRISAPFLGKVEGTVEVSGESMEPTFKNGCRVAIIRLKEIRTLNWGECYFIIDNNWLGTVKRIYPGETANSIKLISDNPNQAKFPPIIRQWNQIVAIFKVQAGILKI